jgi:hypothetical protein
MPLIPEGTTIEQRLFFNSGYIDFGSNRLVDVDNVTVETVFSEKELRRLNSIKMSSHKRSTLKCSLRGKTKSINHEVMYKLMGKQTVEVSGRTISVEDGQASALNPVFTTYINDDVNQPVQFQFTDAILTANPTAATLENFGEMDFTLESRDIKIFFAQCINFGTIAAKITLEEAE